jgi:major membrane immunogen (membrane-anchored lipoprotein)
MKKKLFLGLLLTSTLLVGCGNRQVFDTSWSFTKAIIVIGDEKIEVEVDSWKDYDDTTVQIKTKDGKVYLTDIKNVLLMSE